RKSEKWATDRYVLSVDIGTTSTKGILVNEQGLSVTETSIIHFENHLLAGYHEHDAEAVWWTEFSQVVQSLISTAKVSSSSIKCICVTGMFPCFCPTDGSGKPLHAALLYDDCRALKYLSSLKDYNNTLIEGNELIARI